MLVIESMDADTEVRRVSPIAVHGGDTGFGKYTDLMNGPMDHGREIVRLCCLLAHNICGEQVGVLTILV